MAEVIVTVPVGAGEEDRLFDQFMDGFLTDQAANLEDPDGDAPFVMIRSDPSLGGAVKVVTFQEQRAAAAFSTGWSRARHKLNRN